MEVEIGTLYISKLASQPFEVLEPWGKFDNSLKSVFIHVPRFVPPNFYICTRIPTM